MNTVEWAIRDGVPYAIDFMNPAPDMDINSLTPEYFDWVVKQMADLAIDRALNPRPQLTGVAVGEAVSDGGDTLRESPRCRRMRPMTNLECVSVVCSLAERVTFCLGGHHVATPSPPITICSPPSSALAADSQAALEKAQQLRGLFFGDAAGLHGASAAIPHARRSTGSCTTP